MHPATDNNKKANGRVKVLAASVRCNKQGDELDLQITFALRIRNAKDRIGSLRRHLTRVGKPSLPKLTYLISWDFPPKISFLPTKHNCCHRAGVAFFWYFAVGYSHDQLHTFMSLDLLLDTYPRRIDQSNSCDKRVSWVTDPHFLEGINYLLSADRERSCQSQKEFTRIQRCLHQEGELHPRMTGRPMKIFLQEDAQPFLLFALSQISVTYR